MASSNAAIDLGVHGPNVAVLSACATGAHSIGAAMDMLILGHADLMLAGGTEADDRPLVVDSYDAMGVLSRRNDSPATASRPFDLDRDGFVIGEGAGILVLESYEQAAAARRQDLRRAPRLRHDLRRLQHRGPEPEGTWAAKAMEIAIARSGLGPIRSATSTPMAPRRRPTMRPRPSPSSASSACAATPILRSARASR